MSLQKHFFMAKDEPPKNENIPYTKLMKITTVVWFQGPIVAGS